MQPHGARGKRCGDRRSVDHAVGEVAEVCVEPNLLLHRVLPPQSAARTPARGRLTGGIGPG